MPTDTNLDNLIINQLTKAQYDSATINDNELYFVTDDDSFVEKTDIVNNVTSTATNKPLSANMGKELQDQIDNLKARGRFLALWNSATGLAETNPTISPYTYSTGDYFIVGIIDSSADYPAYDTTATYNTDDKCSYNGDYYICNEDNVTGAWDSTKWTAHTITNYKPNGSSYTTGVASSTVETGEVAIDDVYYYDGTNWKLQANTQKTVSFANIAGQPTDNLNLASALNAKVSDVQIQGNSIVSNGVATIPIASTTVPGIIEPSAYYSIGVNSYTGRLYCGSISYANYPSSDNFVFISKGTLENVITGKNLETANNKVTSISSASTDTQYPSAKCVYDMIGDIETLLQNI